MSSSQELADWIQARKSLLPEELPYLPPSITTDEVPSTPPEQLARIDDARTERDQLRALWEDMNKSDEMEVRFIKPLVDVCESYVKKHKAQAARIEELEKKIKALQAELAESKSQSKTAITKTVRC
jgi:hypothetical protein